MYGSGYHALIIGKTYPPLKSPGPYELIGKYGKLTWKYEKRVQDKYKHQQND